MLTTMLFSVITGCVLGLNGVSAAIALPTIIIVSVVALVSAKVLGLP